MKALGIGRKATAVLLCASMTGALFTGCKKGDDLFPSISPRETMTVETEETGEESVSSLDEGIRQLTVALPYSNETVQCLVSMLYCKNNGLWDSAESGLTVDTDYLYSVATDYVVTNIGCASTGAGIDTVREWSSGDDAPDLFLAQDCQAVRNGGYAEELNSYLSENPYLNAQQIYAQALTNDSEGGVFYAVPHFCSAEIIMGNTEFIPSGTGKLQTKSTAEDLEEYLEAISSEHECVPFASAYELIPYLGSAFNGDVPTSYMVSEEYASDRENAKTIIDRSASFVRDLYEDSLATDLVDGSNPVYSRQAALWTDSSANVTDWAKYYPGTLYLLHIPCDDASNAGVPYISTYSLCVTRGSEYGRFAAEFAAFISFDPDAQLLIYRLEKENMTGLMPLTRNEAVWDLISEDELFGHMASDFRQTMDNAVYCPASYSRIVKKTKDYTVEFVKGNDEFDPEKCYG